MSEFQQINAKISAIEINQKNTDSRLEKHENKIEAVLVDISESLKKISEVMIKQEIQEKSLEENHEDINQLKENYHKQDKKLSLSIQNQESISKAAIKSENNISKMVDEIKTALKSSLKWGAGLFGSLILLLVAIGIKSLVS